MKARFSSRRFFALLATAGLSVLSAACGSSTSATGGSDSGPKETGAVESGLQDSPGGGGDASDGGGTGFPAFAVDYPQILKNTGAILETPTLVTVTWPGQDTSAATWEAFDDGIGASTYWSATTEEYGVASPVSSAATHVRMTEPLPSSLSYYDVQNLVIAALQDAAMDAGYNGGGDAGDAGAPNPVWPSPTTDAKGNVQTLYSLFIPASVTVTDPGSGMGFCEEGGTGFHDSVQLVSGGPWIPYAINLNCAPLGVAGVEETAAHETVEGSTNPYTESMTVEGYINFDTEHLAWDLYAGFGNELADACQNWNDSYFQDTGSFPFWVQRSWSNKSALAGHDPCVPAPATPYYGMTLFPAEESDLSVNLASIGGTVTTTRAFKVTVGQPFSFHVGFYSDAETAPWKISYDFPSSLEVSLMANPLGNGKATVSFDTTTGNNGDKATVTVTPTAKGAAGFQVMAITWDAPPKSALYTTPHYLPILFVDE